MRFRVWEDGIKKEEGDVLLKFVDVGSGRVDVIIVNEKGTREWDVMCFFDGKVELAGGIGLDNYSEGLEKNGDDAIVVVN